MAIFGSNVRASLVSASIIGLGISIVVLNPIFAFSQQNNINKLDFDSIIELGNRIKLSESRIIDMNSSYASNVYEIYKLSSERQSENYKQWSEKLIKDSFRLLLSTAGGPAAEGLAVVTTALDMAHETISLMEKDSQIDATMKQQLAASLKKYAEIDAAIKSAQALRAERNQRFDQLRQRGLFDKISYDPAKGVFSTQSPIRTPPSPNGKWKLTQQGERSKATLDVPEGAIAAIEIACKGKDALSYRFVSRGPQIKEIQPLTANGSSPKLTLDASGIATQGAGPLVGAVDVWERAYSDMSLQMKGQQLPPMQINMLVTNASGLTTRPAIELGGMTAVRDDLRRICAGKPADAMDDYPADKPQSQPVASASPPPTAQPKGGKRVENWQEVVSIFNGHSANCPIAMISNIMPNQVACTLKVDGKIDAPRGIQIWAYRKDLSQTARADKPGNYVLSSIQVRINIATFSKKSESEIHGLLKPLFSAMKNDQYLWTLTEKLKAGKNVYGEMMDPINAISGYYHAWFPDGGRDFMFHVAYHCGPNEGRLAACQSGVLR